MILFLKQSVYEPGSQLVTVKIFSPYVSYSDGSCYSYY